jgi:preprotein translocase subunit SecD
MEDDGHPDRNRGDLPAALPNLLPAKALERLPKWAQSHVVLGLDLRGGSHLLLAVDSATVKKGMAENLRNDVRNVLHKAQIHYSDLMVRGDDVDVRINDASELSRALSKLQELSEQRSGLLGARGQNPIDVANLGGNFVRVALTQGAVAARVHDAQQRSIEIVERRVNELGTVEPTVQSEGSDRILVEVPGLQDPGRLSSLLGKTGKLTFQLVDLSMTPYEALRQQMPPDSEVLYDNKLSPPLPYLVEKRVALSGEDLVDAQPAFDQRSGQPIVSFRLDSKGARRFAEVTRDNVGRPFAIVLDNQVVSAPVIREPITIDRERF